MLVAYVQLKSLSDVKNILAKLNEYIFQSECEILLLAFEIFRYVQ